MKAVAKNNWGLGVHPSTWFPLFRTDKIPFFSIVFHYSSILNFFSKLETWPILANNIQFIWMSLNNNK